MSRPRTYFSESYPYLSVARHWRLPYGAVLTYDDNEESKCTVAGALPSLVAVLTFENDLRTADMIAGHRSREGTHHDQKAD